MGGRANRAFSIPFCVNELSRGADRDQQNRQRSGKSVACRGKHHHLLAHVGAPMHRQWVTP